MADLEERIKQRDSALRMSREAHEFAMEEGTLVWVGEPRECADCEQRAEFEITTHVKQGVASYPDMDTHYYCPLHNADEMFSISVGPDGEYTMPRPRRFSDIESFTVRVLCYIDNYKDTQS